VHYFDEEPVSPHCGWWDLAVQRTSFLDSEMTILHWLSLGSEEIAWYTWNFCL